MTHKRKRYSAEFKLKAVTEVLKGEKTASQLAGELGVHPKVDPIVKTENPLFLVITF